MPYYLMQASYTPEAVAKLKSPVHRETAVRQMVTSMGAKLVGWWLAFGEYDVVAIVEAPDNETAAALSMAAAAGGAGKAWKTTPLMTAEQGERALGKATGAGYQAP